MRSLDSETNVNRPTETHQSTQVNGDTSADNLNGLQKSERNHPPAVVVVPSVPVYPQNEATPPLAAEAQPKPESKGPVRKGFSVVMHSLSNTIDDHTFRHVRLSSPPNRVFYQSFLVSTYRDFTNLLEPDEFITKHRRIDEQELPFRAMVSKVDGASLEQIEANHSLVEWCLLFATGAAIYAFMKVLIDGLALLIADVPIDLPQIVSWVMNLAFFMFTIAIYFFYSYHCWVMERDKFGTGEMFFKDYFALKREAIFPYKIFRQWLV